MVLAALLRECGFEVCLFLLSKKTEDKPSHMACGVKIEGSEGERAFAFVDSRHMDWVYCETTAEGWKAGRMPDDMKIVGEPVQVPPPPKRPEDDFGF
jgi:hypothetical protein